MCWGCLGNIWAWRSVCCTLEKPLQTPVPPQFQLGFSGLSFHSSNFQPKSFLWSFQLLLYQLLHKHQEQVWRQLHRQQEEAAEILSWGSPRPEKLLKVFTVISVGENLLPGCVRTQTEVVDGAEVLSLVPVVPCSHWVWSLVSLSSGWFVFHVLR